MISKILVYAILSIKASRSFSRFFLMLSVIEGQFLRSAIRGCAECWYVIGSKQLFPNICWKSDRYGGILSPKIIFRLPAIPFIACRYTLSQMIACFFFPCPSSYDAMRYSAFLSTDFNCNLKILGTPSFVFIFANHCSALIFVSNISICFCPYIIAHIGQ